MTPLSVSDAVIRSIRYSLRIRRLDQALIRLRKGISR
jgi:hypothetical protein